MGKLLNGINGPFSGKVGTVVGTTWRGIPVIRSKPTQRKGGFSALELQQRAKFSLMNKFLRPLNTLLNQTFETVAVQMTGFNKAFSYNVKNAITGLHPQLAVDYPMVLLGRGDLPNAALPSAASSLEGRLDFKWTDNSGKGKAIATDKAFVAAYNEELNKWKYSLDAAARNAGSCALDTTEFKGKAVHTYIGFISADGKDVTDSLYTGLVNL